MSMLYFLLTDPAGGNHCTQEVKHAVFIFLICINFPGVNIKLSLQNETFHKTDLFIWMELLHERFHIKVRVNSGIGRVDG